METIYVEGCSCSDMAKDGHYRDCHELADGPPFSCVHRIARYGKVATAPCQCTTGHTWHLNGTCLRCNQWVKDTLVLIEKFKYWLKPMGSRCYDKKGITFPKLDYGRVTHTVKDYRGGRTSTVSFTDVNGRFMVDRVLRDMGALGGEWHRPWPNQPEYLMFTRMVDSGGNEVDSVSEQARSALYYLGLIIRPMTYWIPE